MKKYVLCIAICFLLATSLFAAAERFMLWESFEDITPPSWPLNWSYENTNSDDKMWETKTFGSLGERPQCVRYASSITIPADDWFFTSGLTLNSGITYTLSFRYKVSQLVIHKMNIWLGNTPSSISMTNQIYDNNALTDSVMNLVSVNFTVPTTAVYHIGFHCYSDPNQLRLYLDDILVSYPENNFDLTVGMTKELVSSGVPTYNLGDTVRCLAALENIGPADYMVNQRFSVGGGTMLNPELYYQIIGPAGDTLPFIWLYEKLGNPKQKDFIQMPVNETDGKILSLQNAYIFSVPGTYTVTVRYQNYHKHPLGNPVWLGRVWSNPITFILQ